MVQASADNEWESDNQSEEARMEAVCTNTNTNTIQHSSHWPSLTWPSTIGPSTVNVLGAIILYPMNIHYNFSVLRKAQKQKTRNYLHGFYRIDFYIYILTAI